MTDEAWNAPFVRSLGVLMVGNALDEVDERGRQVRGDTLLILLNAHHDEVPFALPTISDGTAWVRDDRHDRALRRGAAATPAATTYPLQGRTLARVRPAQRAAARASPDPSATQALHDGGDRIMTDGTRLTSRSRHQPAIQRGAERRSAIDGRGRVVVERVQPEIDGGPLSDQADAGEIGRRDGRRLRRWPRPACGRREVSAPASARRRVARRFRSSRSATTAGAHRSPSPELGEYEYTVEAWIDRFGTWLKGLVAKADAGQDVVERAARRRGARSRRRRPAEAGRDARRNRRGGWLQPAREPARRGPRLLEIADLLRSAAPQDARVAAARDPGLRALMDDAARSQRRPRRTTARCA